MKILFVDDEPGVLNGLRRKLHDKPWECSFAAGGTAALELLEQEEFDVVVSDLRMPGMDGIELLEHVRHMHPRTARIVLSGYADRDMLLRSTRPAHQFLSKPCDPDDLEGALTRSILLRDLLADTKLQATVASLTSLPSLPSLYVEILEESRSPNGSLQSVGRIIERDIGMSAKILQLVNSAFFGVAQHIDSPAQAAGLLGLEVVKGLVLSVKVFDGFDASLLDAGALEAIWEHSGTTGLLARTICECEGARSDVTDQANVAGLLHDCGSVLLAADLPDGARVARELSQVRGLPTWDAERRILGGDHAAVGGFLLGLWSLPFPVVHATAHHHRLPTDCEPGFSVLAALHAADVFAGDLAPTPDGSTPRSLDMDYYDRIGLADRVEVWRARCEERLSGREEAA